MAQIRIQVNNRLAGSSARSAEEQREGSPTASLRPSAGSAARDAEDRKRAEAQGLFSNQSGFSLRAQNGNVQRRESVGNVGNSVTSPVHNDGVAAYKSSQLSSAAGNSPVPLAPVGNADLTATSKSEAPAAEASSRPAFGTSLVRRIFSAFHKSS